jgi:RNA polymerase sigma-70 factor (ECF subfamily)
MVSRMGDARTQAELLTAAQEGDAAATEELLARHEKSIYRFGLRMCGSEEDAKEVLQETLLAAFRGLRTFRGEAELSTWLYQVARSFCTKARRRHVGGPAVHESLDDPGARQVEATGPSADARTHAKEIGQAIAAALEGLSETHREVVILKDVEGLSAEEIAKVLGEDVAAVKSRIHRARLELRKSLAALIGEGEGPTPCPELTELLSSYVSHDIDQATCDLIEEHLATCPNCTAACSDLQRTVSLCRRIPGDVVPDAVKRAVRKAVRQLAAEP